MLQCSANALLRTGRQRPLLRACSRLCSDEPSDSGPVENRNQSDWAMDTN